MTTLKVLAFVVCAAMLLPARETTIRVPLSPEVTDIVTFDPNRASAADVKRWILLSEHGAYGTPISFDDIYSEPGYQKYQKGREREVGLHNAELNLQKMRKILAELNAQQFPPELAEVVSYFKRLQTFWLWKESQRLKFVKTGDISALEQPFDGIDPKQGCPLALDHIRDAGNRKKAEHIAWYEWGKCINDHIHEQIGPYPVQAWNSFLSNYGIQERLWSEED